jgi:hypothetical protein
MKMTVFWDVVDRPDEENTKHLRNVGPFVPD